MRAQNYNIINKMKNKKNFKCFFLNIVFVYNINMSV